MMRKINKILKSSKIMLFFLIIVNLIGCSRIDDNKNQKMMESAKITIEENNKYESETDNKQSVESNQEDESNVSETDTGGQEALENLKSELEEMISSYDGEWAVYVYDLDTNEFLNINSHAMKSASTIKLFIMATVYDKVASGELELTENINSLMKQMITISHNESSNELVRLLSPTGDNHEEGMKVVNQYTSMHGYADTNQGRDMLDYREIPAKGENYTSVRDTAFLLREIYRGTCVNEEFSQRMMDLLKDQERTWKIPAGLPQGIESANKTGELSDVENDSAIIFGEKTDYILSIMSENLTDTVSAQKNIQEISSIVYQYFNN